MLLDITQRLQQGGEQEAEVVVQAFCADNQLHDTRIKDTLLSFVRTAMPGLKGDFRIVANFTRLERIDFMRSGEAGVNLACRFFYAGDKPPRVTKRRV